MVIAKRTVRSRILEFFLALVIRNTKADPKSSDFPSSLGQIDLGALIAAQLQEIGLIQVVHDDFGYVYATIPSNVSHPVPTIALFAHMDTSYDCSGENVKPQIHENYGGQDITFPDDVNLVLRMAEHTELQNQIGNKLITASGKTLLGSDDKSGCAVLMDLAYYLTKDPNPPAHGEIRLVFTPDEEIGKGVKNINMDLVNASVGYTLDGGGTGEVEFENFTAYSAEIKITGVATHPGYAYGKMENAAKIAAIIVATLPDDLSPEKTQGRQGYIYACGGESNLHEATIQLMLRGYSDDEIETLSGIVKNTIASVMKTYPSSTHTYNKQEIYRNMKEVIDKHPEVLEHARTAIQMAGLEPHSKPIRGGTDGARLSFMGLPCPNLSAGEHNIHSLLEWTSEEDMKKCLEVTINLLTVWCEAAES